MSFMIKRNCFFRLPDDIWMVDLDSNKLTPARADAELPLLPEPEGTILKNHLKQVRLFPSFPSKPILLLQIAQFYYESTTKVSHHVWTFLNLIKFPTYSRCSIFKLAIEIELSFGKCEKKTLLMTLSMFLLEMDLIKTHSDLI